MAKKYFYVDSPLYKLECTARICNRHFTVLFRDSFQKLGITEGEFQVLDTIVRTPDITQIELARLLCKGRSHITQMLNSLENKGFVKRDNNVKNGRMVRHTVLTSSGNEIYEKISSLLEANFVKMTKFLEGKEELLVGMLDEIKNIITEGQEVSFE